MNSRERFLAALNGYPVDRPPVAHLSALTTVALQETTGCRMPHVHTHPSALVRLSGANHDLLGFDAVTFLINYFNEPAACGAEMDWGNEREYPRCTSLPWQTPEDAQIPSHLLDRPPLPACLEAIQLAKAQYGDRIAVLGKIMGPFSMVLALHGIENTLVDILEAPDRIHHFLSIATAILIDFGRAQFKAGADALAVGEGGAGGTMISPSLHRELLLPYHQQLVRALPGPLLFHICGDITPRLELLSETGFSCFHFDWAISPSVMKQHARNRFRIMGNINTTTLRYGTPAEVRNQVHECRRAGVDILAPGCAISPECPNENLRAIVEAASS